jgi:TetR/AcrR family transcriptional repressor of lmrAB and yxaGH operons
MTRTIFEKADVVPLLAEVFRALGYEGATLSRITERTGLGKGSLYHFFPGGKEEMAATILADVDLWFVQNVYEPLERDDPRAAVAAMWKAAGAYFHSGRRACLVGAFALDSTRDRFAVAIRDYFVHWIKALEGALRRAGVDATRAKSLAEEVVLGVQGALVLARALNDEAVFKRTLERLAHAVDAAIPHHPATRKRQKGAS